ncbi:type II toxin-antitoxin system RelE/ParE family toxin [Nitrosomonas sp. Is35]|uniref:type II toxin-antitoxin system RelE/ParE family toxin n=1 Tax=Nitrosomonas sp. Is35 TaxID=3080534 RepID=UPI00294AC193|nr:type II toxin-antitoxin system RelE/ParE family toxin [Nitrosomonas sp. Is35]MDV6346071.1 type II toxin-antitoxin system RelE/ParE family toxin [Nitrosomonas sp. Is35]
MAFRLKFSARALREIGEARTWYETQHSGLGEEFIAAIELQLKRLEQAPLLYAEVISKVHRALLPRFPYGLFYVVRHDLIYVLAVLHDARNPSHWPRAR